MMCYLYNIIYFTGCFFSLVPPISVPKRKPPSGQSWPSLGTTHPIHTIWHIHPIHPIHPYHPIHPIHHIYLIHPIQQSDANWYWMMQILSDWCWCMLIDADWCSNKVQPGFLLPERTSGASPVIFGFATISLLQKKFHLKVRAKSTSKVFFTTMEGQHVRLAPSILTPLSQQWQKIWMQLKVKKNVLTFQNILSAHHSTRLFLKEGECMRFGSYRLFMRH